VDIQGETLLQNGASDTLKTIVNGRTDDEIRIYNWTVDGVPVDSIHENWFFVSDAGTYCVEVEDNDGCVGNACHTVNVAITKEIDINDVYKYGVVLSDEDGKVLSFQEKPTVKEAKSNIINTGIYIFEPEIFDYIPKDRKYDIGGELLPSLLEMGKEFYSFKMDFKWVDVGTTKEFYEANMTVLKKETCYIKPYYKNIIDKNIFVGINCSIDFNKVDIQGPVYIGNSVKIEDGCQIVGPCVINSNSEISKNSYIKDSIILNHTIISENSHITNSIVSQDFCIEVE